MPILKFGLDKSTKQGENFMPAAVTAKQIFQHLSPYDLERVTFRMPDGLPVVTVYIDTDMEGGAIITMSDSSDVELHSK
jgi:hypothetical protein